MKAINLIALALLVICKTPSNAEVADAYISTIRGKVVDKTTGLPLPGATILLLNYTPQVGTITDTDGSFRLENIKVGRQSLKISFIGYSPAVLNNLLLTSGKELVLNISLTEMVVQTEEITVTAEIEKEKAINKMATVSARSFTVEETERYAGSLGDPSRMASNFAGVAMINDQRNDIIIRGNTPSGLLWRLDGIEIPNPNHFGAFGTTGGPVSMLNNNLLTNSDFFTSAFPAEYGNAISGVFDLKMRSGNNQKREYTGQIGFNGFELGAEGPFVDGGKASYMANFRYSTLEFVNTLGIDIGVGTAVPQYKDLTFKLDFPGTKMGRISIVGLGGLSFIALHDSDKAKADTNDNQNYNYPGTDLDYGSDMGVVGISHLYYFNETTRLQSFISVLGTRSKTSMDSLRFDSIGNIIENSNFDFVESFGTEVKYSISTHLQKKFNTKNVLKTGMYLDIYKMLFKDSAFIDNTWESNFNFDGQLSLIRPYVQFQHRFSDELTLNTGIYSQYVDLNKEFSVEPRFGLKYMFAGNQSLSFGYGLHGQIQPRITYFISTELNDGSTILTNKDVKMTKSHQLVLGYDNLLKENFRFKSEVYYQYLFNVPVNKSIQEYSTLNSGDDFYAAILDSMVNKGTGRNYGVEFTLEKFLSKGYYFLGTVSLFESKYKGYDGVERNTAFNGNYVVNLLGGYEYNIGDNNALTMDIKTIYAGGKRFIPINLEQSKLDREVVYDWSHSFENQFGNYFRVDLRLGFKMNMAHANQEWAIDFQNLTNHKNIYKEDWSPRTGELSRVYQIGFYPMFLWRIQF